MNISDTPSPPHARSYWVVPGRFAAGCYPGDLDPTEAAAKRQALLAAGITDFVSLMEAGEGDHSGKPFVDYWPALEAEAKQLGHEVAFHRFPIVDGNIPTPKTMAAITATLSALLSTGRNIYVHCWGGRGRTGTVVACWLGAAEGLDGQTAIARLQQLTESPRKHFRPTPETSIQHAFVDQWLSRR